LPLLAGIGTLETICLLLRLLVESEEATGLPDLSGRYMDLPVQAAV